MLNTVVGLPAILSLDIADFYCLYVVIIHLLLFL